MGLPAEDPSQAAVSDFSGAEPGRSPCPPHQLAFVLPERFDAPVMLVHLDFARHRHAVNLREPVASLLTVASNRKGTRGSEDLSLLRIPVQARDRHPEPADGVRAGHFWSRRGFDQLEGVNGSLFGYVCA